MKPVSSKGYPFNIIGEIERSLKDNLAGGHTFIKRALRITDPARSASTFALTWQPMNDSQQIGQMEPALNRYELRIQTLVKHANEEEGIALSSLDAKSVRVILYRDPNLKIRLLALSEELMSSRETVKRYGVRRQNLLNTDIKGVFCFLTTTEIWVESETVKL